MPFNVQSVLDELRTAQESANTANEGRYQELLGELRRSQSNVSSRGQQSLSELDNLGRSSSERVRRDFRENLGNNAAGALSRGLGNTTVVDSLNARSRSDRDFALTDIDERVSQLRSGALERLGDREAQSSRDISGAIERRTDVADQGGTLNALLRQLGEAEGGRPAHTYNTIGASGTGSGGSSYGGGGGGSGGSSGRSAATGGGGGSGGGRRTGVQTYTRDGNTGGAAGPAASFPVRIRAVAGAGSPGPGWSMAAGYWQAPSGTPVSNGRYGGG